MRMANEKREPSPGVDLERNPPAQQLDIGGDRQPQPRAPLPLLLLLERLEDRRLFLLGDARTRVDDLEGVGVALLPGHFERNRPGFSEFHRVAQQIDQHLSQLDPVAAHFVRWQVGL